MRRKIITLAVLALCLTGTVSSLRADDFNLHGSLSDRYRFRTAGGLIDSRMETILTLDFGDARSDRFSGALQAGGVLRFNERTNTTLGSVYDSFGQAVPRIYYAYFDAKDLKPIKNLRFGRQHRYEFESLYYDGLTLESAPFHGLTLTTFAGIPVHLFETNLGFDPGDWLVGGALQWNPLSNFQGRFDVVHLKDKVEGFRAATGDQEDNLFGGTVWWDLDPHVGFMGRFTSFSDQVRDVSGETSLRFPEKDLSFRFNFYRLLQGYAVRVIDLDAFAIAGTYEPYTEFSLNATKGIGDHFAVDAGGAFRFLDNFQPASAFNHGYDRAYLSLSTFDFLVRGLTLTGTTDYYRGRDNVLKDDTFGSSFIAAQKLLNNRLKVSGGTAFYLYRFNLLTGNEASDVQTYFARIEGKIFKNLNARAGYEFENNPMNHFHTIDLRLLWNF